MGSGRFWACRLPAHAMAASATAVMEVFFMMFTLMAPGFPAPETYSLGVVHGTSGTISRRHVMRNVWICADSQAFFLI
jgi:hypothetical protein